MESNNEYILTCIGSFSRRDVAVKENHCNDERLLAIMLKQVLPIHLDGTEMPF